jgi:hypothetical protein
MSVLSEVNDGAQGALDFIHQVNSFISKTGAYAGNQSLVTASRHARVEPPMIVDAAAMTLDGINETAQVMQSLFSGYYLMAAEMITNIDGVKVRERLAPLNPNRQLDLDLLSFRMAQESYSMMLPTKANRLRLTKEAYPNNAKPGSIEELEEMHKIFLEEFEKRHGNDVNFAPPNIQQLYHAEAADYANTKRIMEAKERHDKKGKDEAAKLREIRSGIDSVRRRQDELKQMNSTTVSVSGAGKEANDITTLSVGKMFDVKIVSEGREATVKVGIRVMAKYMPTVDMVTMMTAKGALDHDLVERYHGWRAGRLSFWKDLVLCRDLIEAHRNAAIRDKSGTYSEIMARNRNAVGAGLLERNPSMAVFSTLCIMSASTLNSIEAKMGGSINNSRVRNTLFDTTKMMILAVIDPGYETVTFYTHGIAGHTEIPLRALKTSKKDDGGVMDIMKAFLAGRSPTL